MPNNLTTNYGKVVVDTSLIPYIRSRDIEFVARNLKPYKLSKIFFDDIAVNPFCQVGNEVVLDSKKIVVVSKNAGPQIATSDIAYQGTSNTVNTFNAIVDAWYTSNSTIVLRTLSGNFDEDAQLFIEAATAHDSLTIGTTFANCNVSIVSNFNTSDTFSPGEGVVNPQGGNVFAKVLATSGENALYLNQNFITLNVTAVGANSLSAMSNDYKVGDIVYQTSGGLPIYDLSSFTGVVEYYNINSPGTLAIRPTGGALKVNATSTTANANVRIWNASNSASQPLAGASFNQNGFKATQNVQSTTNTSNKIKVTSYVHRSGILANTSNANAKSLILAVTDAGNHENMNGNLIYFTTGVGVGEIRRIVAIAGSVATLNTDMQVGYGSTTHYSVGNPIVDQYGTQAGIFHIPSFTGFKFLTGNRVLTITDTDTYNSPDYTMRAAATYAAGGLLKTTQNIQTSPTLAPFPEVEADTLIAPVSPAERVYNATNSKTPVTGITGSTTPRIPLGDGLSQTFFTPRPLTNKEDNGIFVTSVDLFFKSKPSVARAHMQLPVTVKIAMVSNGYPTKSYLASKTIQAKDVNISDLPSVSDSSTLTKFTFDDPVYLEPNREYALIIGSDSPEYELHIAQLGAEVLGAIPPRRISEQPYAGSLFRSQNSSTWTAYQNEDLMFQINKAVFQSSGTATFNLDNPPTEDSAIDRVVFSSTDLKFPTATVEYKLRGVYAADDTYDSGKYIVPYGAIDYGVEQDKSSSTSINRRQLLQGNSDSFVMTLEMSSTDPDVSPMVNTERLGLVGIKYNINNAGLAGTLLSITNKGAGYNATMTSGTHTSANAMIGSSNNTLNNYAQLVRETVYANNFQVGFYAANISGGGGTGATGFFVANTQGTGTVDAFVIMTTGRGYIETPTVEIPSGNSTTNAQAFASFSGETDKSGGNIRSKYISREIVLEEGFESGDLRVYMDAIRPSPVDIQVYYKVVSDEDPQIIADKTWRRMEKVKDVYSVNPRTMIGLEFRPSLTENRISYTEDGVVYPVGGKFRKFQIKVCLLSPDPALIPKIKNLRIIATPEG